VNRCPVCGEWTRARWQPLPEVPGYGRVYKLDHRRAGGARCNKAVRGDPLPDQNACTGGDETGILGGRASRSVRDSDRATA